MMKRSILMTAAALFGAVQAWGATVECATWVNLRSNLEAGNSVKLTANISQGSEISVVLHGKTATLDLNGYKITGSSNTYYDYRIAKLMEGSSLTITDGSSAKTGMINGNNILRVGNGGCIYIYSGCTLTVNGGAITNYASSMSGGAVYNGGTFKMNGGKISKCTSTENGGAVCNAGTFTMNGGVLTGNKASSSTTSASAIIYNTGTATVNGGVSDNSHIGDFKASGMSSTKVGSLYVIGRNVSVSSSSLAGGTFTFDPSVPTYAGAGLSRLSTCTVSSETSATPTWYTLKSTNVASAPSWRDVKANLEAGTSVRLTASVSQGTVRASISGKTVTLDLNGYTITGSSQTSWEYRMISVYDGTSLTLTDGSSGKTGKINGNNVSRSGSGGCVAIATGSTFIMNGGTITKCTTTGDGGAFSNLGTFTMNGGTISSCTSVTNGAAIYSTGTFTMNGGTISSCTSSKKGGAVYNNAGTVTIAGGTISGCTATAGEGGAIYTSGGTITMSSGKITGNAANGTAGGTGNGGGIALRGSGTLNLSGGEISNNTSTRFGGGLAVISSSTLTMTGGTISGNSSPKGNAIECDATTATINGGTISGHTVSSTGTIHIRGLAKLIVYGGLFTGNTAGDPIYKETSTPSATVYGAVADVSTIGTYKASDATCTQVGSLYLVGRNISVSNSALAGGTFTFNPFASIYMSAGLSRLTACTVSTETSATPTWYTLKSTNVASAPSWRDVKANLEAGTSVKLTASVSQGSIPRAYIDGKTVTLNLNGYTITGSSDTSTSGRFAYLYNSANLTLTDSSSGKTGKIDGNNVSRTVQGSCVYVSSGCALTINGGTVTKYKTTSNGGAVYNAGTITMNGGTISGNNAERGGAVYNDGTANIYGGTFEANAASAAGGCFYCNQGDTTYIYGGYFSGNTASSSDTSIYVGYWNEKNGKLYGGVFADGDPTTADQSRACLVLQDSAAVTLVGSKYIVGAGIVYHVNNKLIAGTYTFCPTDAEYAAAGVALASGSSTQKTGNLAWQIVSGTAAGDNVRAYLADGVCTVYGTGATANVNPLGAQWASIKDVRITDGVTGLGTYFFHKFYNLTNVTIAASCTSLGEGALFRCLSLEQVTFEGDTLPTLGENALPVRAAIKMEGDKPVVTLVPKVIVGGKEPTLKGSNDLSNWENVTVGNEGDYHFFKYVIQ